MSDQYHCAPVSCKLDWRGKVLLTKTGWLSWEVGRTPLTSVRQELMECLALADSRKMRPRSMLTLVEREKEEGRDKGEAINAVR